MNEENELLKKERDPINAEAQPIKTKDSEQNIIKSSPEADLKSTVSETRITEAKYSKTICSSDGFTYLDLENTHWVNVPDDIICGISFDKEMAFYEDKIIGNQSFKYKGIINNKNRACTTILLYNESFLSPLASLQLEYEGNFDEVTETYLIIHFKEDKQKIKLRQTRSNNP